MSAWPAPIAEDISCSSCGALAGQPCMTFATGHPKRKAILPHEPRMKWWGAQLQRLEREANPVESKKSPETLAMTRQTCDSGDT